MMINSRGDRNARSDRMLMQRLFIGSRHLTLFRESRQRSVRATRVDSATVLCQSARHQTVSGRARGVMNTRTSNILIIGGGILGTALAYYLGRRGTRNVTLLEKGEPGDGSTGKSAAIVRMHYTNPATVQLALRSRELFLNWTDAVDPQPVAL